MQLEDYFEFEQFKDRDRIRVKGTRVDIDILLDAFHQGATPEQIQQSYPTVTREQVYATITYYLHNQQEVDAYLQRGREVAEADYQEWLRTHKPSPLELRLRQVRESAMKNKQAQS
jgi:uncharacterized protein (DUF433 family)